MERTKVDTKDTGLNDAFEFIFQNALGSPILLNAAPTQASDMKGNVLGYYNNKFYIVLSNGTLFSITLTPV